MCNPHFCDTETIRRLLGLQQTYGNHDPVLVTTTSQPDPVTCKKPSTEQTRRDTTPEPSKGRHVNTITIHRRGMCLQQFPQRAAPFTERAAEKKTCENDSSDARDAEQVKTCRWRLTDWHKGLRGRAVTRHADAIDSINSHFVRHAFNHPLGFIGGSRERVKVQPHPPVALLLLPLHHIT